MNDDDDIDNKCVICDRAYTLDLNKEVVPVKIRALQRLLASSLARKDGKEELFRNKLEIRLHKRCQLKYICDKAILSYIKKSQAKPCDTSQSIKCDKTTKPKPIKPVIDDEPESDCDESVFNPDKCIFCYKYADKEFIESERKNPPHKRIIVIRVTKKETKANILKGAAKYKDYLSQQVLLRIANVDLVEAKAVYHHKCFCRFLFFPTGNKRGRRSIYVDIDEKAKNDQTTEKFKSIADSKVRLNMLRNSVKKALRRRQMHVKRKEKTKQSHEEQLSFKPDWNNKETHDSIEEEDPLLDTNLYEESMEDHIYDESMDDQIPESPNLSISPAPSIKREESPSNMHVINEVLEYEDPVKPLNIQEEKKLADAFENGNSGDRKLDELDHFFLSLSRAVKQLPKLHQNRLKMDFRRAVCEARLGDEEIQSEHAVKAKEESVDF